MQWHKKVHPNSAEQKPSSSYNPGQYIMVGIYFGTIFLSFRLSSLFNLCSLEKCLFFEVHISISNALRAFSPWSLLSTCCITICAVSKKIEDFPLFLYININMPILCKAKADETVNYWSSGVYLHWLADPGKARGCSINSFVINSVTDGLWKYLYGAATPSWLKMVLSDIK